MAVDVASTTPTMNVSIATSSISPLCARIVAPYPIESMV